MLASPPSMRMLTWIGPSAAGCTRTSAEVTFCVASRFTLAANSSRHNGVPIGLGTDMCTVCMVGAAVGAAAWATWGRAADAPGTTWEGGAGRGIASPCAAWAGATAGGSAVIEAVPGECSVGRASGVSSLPASNRGEGLAGSSGPRSA